MQEKLEKSVSKKRTAIQKREKMHFHNKLQWINIDLFSNLFLRIHEPMAYIIYIYSEKLSVDVKLDSVSCSLNCILLLDFKGNTFKLRWTRLLIFEKFLIDLDMSTTTTALKYPLISETNSPLSNPFLLLKIVKVNANLLIYILKMLCTVRSVLNYIGFIMNPYAVVFIQSG